MKHITFLGFQVTPQIVLDAAGIVVLVIIMISIVIYLLRRRSKSPKQLVEDKPIDLSSRLGKLIDGITPTTSTPDGDAESDASSRVALWAQEPASEGPIGGGIPSVVARGGMDTATLGAPTTANKFDLAPAPTTAFLEAEQAHLLGTKDLVLPSGFGGDLATSPLSLQPDVEADRTPNGTFPTVQLVASPPDDSVENVLGEATIFDHRAMHDIWEPFVEDDSEQLEDATAEASQNAWQTARLSSSTSEWSEVTQPQPGNTAMLGGAPLADSTGLRATDWNDDGDETSVFPLNRWPLEGTGGTGDLNLAGWSTDMPLANTFEERVDADETFSDVDVPLSAAPLAPDDMGWTSRLAGIATPAADESDSALAQDNASADSVDQGWGGSLEDFDGLSTFPISPAPVNTSWLTNGAGEMDFSRPEQGGDPRSMTAEPIVPGLWSEDIESVLPQVQTEAVSTSGETASQPVIAPPTTQMPAAQAAQQPGPQPKAAPVTMRAPSDLDLSLLNEASLAQQIASVLALPGARQCAIVRRDGSAIAGSLRSSNAAVREDDIEALLASVLSASARSTGFAEFGAFGSLTIIGRDAMLVLLDSGPLTLLAVLAAKDTKLGPLRRSLRRHSEDIKEILVQAYVS